MEAVTACRSRSCRSFVPMGTCVGRGSCPALKPEVNSVQSSNGVRRRGAIWQVPFFTSARQIPVTDLIYMGLFVAIIFAIGGVICHQTAREVLFLEGQQLPVCARCTGFMSAATLGLIALDGDQGRAPVAPAGDRSPRRAAAACNRRGPDRVLARRWPGRSLGRLERDARAAGHPAWRAAPARSSPPSPQKT